MVHGWLKDSHLLPHRDAWYRLGGRRLKGSYAVVYGLLECGHDPLHVRSDGGLHNGLYGSLEVGGDRKSSLGWGGGGMGLG